MKKQDFKTVIVGVDFSKYSKAAAEQGALLSKQFKAKLVFVHIQENLSLLPDFDEHSKQAKQVADRTRGLIRKAYAGSAGDADIVVKSGNPEVEILKAAEKFPRPLIVVGHKGKGAFSRFFIGSVAEALSLNSEVPVWIHLGNKTKVPEKVLVPMDVISPAKKWLKQVSHLKLTQPPRTDLFYVLDSVPPFLDYRIWQMAEKAHKIDAAKNIAKIKRSFPEYNVKQIPGEPVTEILKAEKAYDLVVLSPRRTKTAFPLMSRVATKVLRHSIKPILVIPEA